MHALKSRVLVKVSKLVQSQPYTPGYQTDSWNCTVPLRQETCMPVAFVTGSLVLHQGNTNVIMCNCGGVSQQMRRQWSLQFVLTGRAVNMGILPIP